ncbi:MAG: RNA pyrophosphohydrolase [Holosporaceae bacterium]|nr:RNA pyrophosphohydrolase [Holosporaceae bacterium]
MKRNRKLVGAWLIFITTVVLFVAGVELYHYFRSEYVSNYQCRILINEDLANLESKREKPGIFVRLGKEENADPDIGFYERTKYGELPRIIGYGRQIFDVYSSPFKASPPLKRVFVAVQVEDTDPESFAAFIRVLGNAKVTFIFPHYLGKLEEIASIVVKNGHEFFLQIPTQSSIPDDKKNTISPFLANADPDDMLEKLRYLTASAKYAIGVANTTPTLLTKSKKDMSIIGNELAKRGLALLDLEKSNEMLSQLSKESGLIYHNIGYRSSAADVSKIKDNDSVVVPFEQITAFTKGLAEDFVVAPVSVSMKRFSMLPYRKCVAIFLIKDGKVLVGQRADIPGAWQLPQGGVDEGENFLEAARRELFEEVNARTIQALGSTARKYRYDFPESFQRKFEKNGKAVKYAGQELSFVVFDFLGDDGELNVAKENREFSSWKWITVEELLQTVVDFKRQAYEKAIRELKQLKVFL